MAESPRIHSYHTQVRWTGNKGVGTTHATAYTRDHVVTAAGKTEIACSSDPAFRGDPTKHNPEEMLVSAVSSCHMLWYLHLCADAGVVVTDYVDTPEGSMEETSDGGAFTEIILHPVVTITEASKAETAHAIHAVAHTRCFIANSVRCVVRVQGTVRSGEQTDTMIP